MAYLDGFSVRPYGEANSVDGTFAKGVSYMEMPQIFENREFGAVRTFRDKAGEPLFVAKDVALALGYEWNGNARIAHVPAEWRGVTSVVTPSGTQEMVVLTEQGLYFFLGRSDKPKALPFQKWLAGEVLPAIRKHGGYLTPKKLEEALLNPDVLIRLATRLKEEREARVQAEARVAILSHVRKTYTTTEIAKELGMRSAVALNRLLCERRVQFKQNGTYVLYAEYAEHGYVHIKQEILENDKIVYHRRWTQLGREWLLDMLGCTKSPPKRVAGTFFICRS